MDISHRLVLFFLLTPAAQEDAAMSRMAIKVSKTPNWPRSWANFSLLELCYSCTAWANLHILGQPNTFLAQDHRLPGRVAGHHRADVHRRRPRLAGRRDRGRLRQVRPGGHARGRPSEKDTKLAQKLGQLQHFIAVFPQECMGQLGYFGPT